MTALALLLVLAAPPKLAIDTTFFDSSWRHVQRANAVYYGWNTPLDSGRCRIQDFYLSGERQMEALGWSGPPVVKDGPVTYFFRSGPKSTTGRFVNGKREGEWRYWNEDGTLRRKITWHASRQVLATYTIKAADSDVPQLIEQMPKFLGPLPLAQYLGATMHRPASMPAGGGQVFVQFVVGPQGNITSTRIVKGFDPACDAEALRAVAALPRWQPGLQNGQPAAVRFVIPITFR
ncbi:energy transducer TonB [Hymenobacter sp. UV11]|uniref:energy transducer TonB n=1 Tax=Hymenobacter sp. UV11 TaxID=1849735 RepID=UPI0014150C9D|nr:energy transducer TonB [Hymenobacter sp. UV11]